MQTLFAVIAGLAVAASAVADSDSSTGRLAPLGYAGLVQAVAFSPDGTTLASWSSDNTVVLWDIASQRRQATLKEQVDPDIFFRGILRALRLVFARRHPAGVRGRQYRDPAGCRQSAATLNPRRTCS